MNKKHLRVIKMIQDGIPKDLLMNLTKKEIQAPTIKKVFELALTKPDDEVSPRQKRNIQAMLDSGRLDREVEVLDYAVEKEIDAYITAEIDKAVKLGRLPAQAPQLKRLKNKGIQYAKRQERRLRREFLGETSDVEDEAPDGKENASVNPSRQDNHPTVPTPSAAIL
jgi:tRNA A37 N6-isopentenylltransferase MiaA